MLIVEVGSISIKLSEYRVLCIHAVEQAMKPLLWNGILKGSWEDATAALKAYHVVKQ